MKKILNILLIILILGSCTEDERDLSFVDSIVAPTNVAATYDITQDNTGSVTITPTADGASNFKVYFGDNTAEPAELAAGESVVHVYAEGTYDLKIEAFSLNGKMTESTQQLVVSFKAPENLVATVENDQGVSRQVNVTATADFATMFEFYSGESGVSQPVATANIGETISYQYAMAGDYDIRVVAKGAAIATT
ncbi:MAG: PKD domain protein, partial [Tenacibaculum sp.]|nr:PKD domain protein [Tenacibaculum sp.]